METGRKREGNRGKVGALFFKGYTDIHSSVGPALNFSLFSTTTAAYISHLTTSFWLSRSLATSRSANFSLAPLPGKPTEWCRNKNPNFNGFPPNIYPNFSFE